MAKVERYQDLIAWQKAYALSLRIYELSRGFPSDERFSLTQQIRRAAVSIPSNIAEGFGRHHRPDYLRFLDMANGSLFELQTQVLMAKDLQYHRDDMIFDELRELERILAGLIRALRKAPGH